MSTESDIQRLFYSYNGDKQLFNIAVALGKVLGWQNFRKFGDNNTVPASGFEEMWPPGTPRVLPTSAAVVSIVSTAAADDKVAVGTGAHTIRIEGCGADMAPLSEDVDLDGTLAVTSTNTFMRVNRAYITDVGTSEQNTGDLSLSIGGNLQAFIPAGYGQTHQTQYTVPLGMTLLIDALTVGVGRMVGGTDCHIETYARLEGQGWRSLSDVYLYSGGSIFRNGDSIVYLPEKSEIRQIITSTSETQAHSVYQGWLIENKYLNL